METITIDILNPKAINIIKDLAEVNLIRLNKSKTISDFTKVLTRLRENSDDVPSLEQIAEEVKSIRHMRSE